ncbi:MAG: lysine--tRNA ligase [Alphaproteobacteria bacterium]|nr:lysine--tRNA ligase [Alphaproteobacteria bacterium]
MVDVIKSRVWPFEEARKILSRFGGQAPSRPVIFETGYGPSGIPHIGTFGEVARTAMVRHAFHVLTNHEWPSRLICFSDDMDGLRKIPDNVPNQSGLQAYLGYPLSKVPNPFLSDHDSFAAHNNAQLCHFLDKFDFDYEFVSASKCYTSGCFDDFLLRLLSCYEEVMEVILPTIGEERRRTYAPFLPVHPESGVVMQVPVEERDVLAGLIVWTDPATGKRYESKVTGGGCKAQWKPDWALRWAALGVDYEMYGKDHIDNVKLSSRICRILGGHPPEGFSYELFLDEDGQKISKTKGNGLTIDEWLRYASPESLSLFMYQAPRRAKRLHFDIIPRSVDDYLSFLELYPSVSPEAQLESPVWHIHSGVPPVEDIPISFSMLLNLVSASNAEDKEILWGFIGRYAEGVTARTHPGLDKLVEYALAYFQDFVRPFKCYRPADEREFSALQDLACRLRDVSSDASANVFQGLVYDVGKAHGFDHLREWFKAIYEILFGQSQGPRLGSFIRFYGRDQTCDLITRALSGHISVS